MKKKFRKVAATLEEMGYSLTQGPTIDGVPAFYVVTPLGEDVTFMPPVQTVSEFKFELGDKVELTLSLEEGEVIGRANYTNRPPLYYVRYEAGDGRQVEAWLDGDAIDAVEEDIGARSIGDILSGLRFGTFGYAPFHEFGTVGIRPIKPSEVRAASRDHAEAIGEDLED